MNAYDTVWACTGIAVGLCLIATYGWDAWHKNRTTRRFQRSARQAARGPRTEAEVRDDLDKARAALDLAECLAIWNATQHDIPHQIRRTEEDQ